MGSGFQEICNMYAVCFDLIYDEGISFSGKMDAQFDEWPLVRVKIVFGCRESVWLVLQIILQLTSLTFIILFNIEGLRRGGNKSCLMST
nr:hypothetical protein [Torque teno Leptonychotes weddellii virus 1]